MTIRSTLLLGSMLLALGLISGCSSGGGGSGPDTGPSGLVTSNAAGTVADGIIRQGQVVANELDENGNVLRQVGSATTDNQGQYSLTIDSSYGGGPLQFLLTGDANTTMVCDVHGGCGTRTDTLADPNGNGTVDYREEMSVNGLTMEALIGHANAGDTLSVSITPFTTAAANRAHNAGTLNQAAVDDANSSISNLLGGIDILGERPVDLTNQTDVDATSTTESRITYSALVSAVSKLAFNTVNADVGSLQVAIGKLNTAMGGATIGATTGFGGAFSLQDILNAAKAQFPPGRSDQTGALTAMQAKIDVAIGGAVNIIPNPNTGDTNIAKAKALVGEIRTWGVSLGSSGSTVDAFYNKIRTADTVTDFTQFSSLAKAVDIMVSIATDPASTQGTPIPYNDASGTGDVTFTVSNGEISANINGTVGDNTVALNATFPEPGDTSATQASASLSGTVSSTIVNNNNKASGATLVIFSGSSADITYSPAQDPYTLSQAQLKTSIDTADLSLDMKFDQLNVANPVMYTGTADVSVRSFKSGADAALIPTSISLDGTVTDSIDTFKITLNGTLNDASSYDPFSPESSTNTWDGTIAIGLTLDLANLPQAQLTVSVHHTGFNSITNQELGSASLVLTHGGNTLTANASQDSNGTLSQITFRDTAGATLTVTYTGGNATGALTVGSTSVGIVSSLNNNIIKVSYSDGTFETLN